MARDEPAAITADDIRAAMIAMETQPYRAHQHIIRPPKPGMRWEVVDDTAAEIIRCRDLCNWAAYARQVEAR